MPGAFMSVFCVYNYLKFCSFISKFSYLLVNFTFDEWCFGMPTFSFWSSSTKALRHKLDEDILCKYISECMHASPYYFQWTAYSCHIAITKILRENRSSLTVVVARGWKEIRNSASNVLCDAVINGNSEQTFRVGVLKMLCSGGKKGERRRMACGMVNKMKRNVIFATLYLCVFYYFSHCL